MIRKKILVLALGILLILYLILGAYLSSSVLTFATEKFKENCIWQTKYAQALVTESLPKGANTQDVKNLENNLNIKLGKHIEIITFEPKEREEELRQAFAGRTGTRITHDEHGRELLVALPLPEGRVLRTSFSMEEIARQEDELRYGLVGGALGLLVLSFFFLNKLIVRQTEPLESVTKSMQEYLAGNNKVRLPLKDNGEYGQLAYGFNSLADNYADKSLDLEREKHKNKIILDHMDNAMALIGKDGDLLECNKPFAEYFDILDGKAGKTYEDLLHKVKLQDFLRQCLEKEDGLDLVFNIVKSDQKRVYRVFGAPLKEAFQQYPTSVLTVFHDITALQAIYDKQTTFVSNASHELQTPLTTIRGFADTLLEDDTAEIPELRHKFLGIILDESKRMQSLIKDLLQLAKLDQAEYRQNIKIEAFSVEPVLKTLNAEFKEQAEKRCLTLTVEEQNPLKDVVVSANKDWFKQILVNLTENALKYTPSGGQINIGYTVGDKLVEFTVHNTGEGISQEDAKKIFDRFYRLDKARSRAQGGSGLGLSIVKLIVEILGGNIRVESKPGQGVSFIFTLPRGEEEKNGKI